MRLILLVIITVSTLKSDISADRRQLKSGNEPDPSMGIRQSTEEGVEETPGTLSSTNTPPPEDNVSRSEIIPNPPRSATDPAVEHRLQTDGGSIGSPKT